MMEAEEDKVSYSENDLECQQKYRIGIDDRLLKKWNALAQAGSFRYLLGSGRQRVLPGKYSFLAQYQPNRAKMRRAPQAMYSLAQQPDPAKFNFNKVDKSKEKVFVFKNLDSSAESLLLINVSPIDIGHCLLVPNIEKVLPQQITEESALGALHFLSLSTSPDIRIGFNSLCAHASVNHMHWHVYYQAHSSWGNAEKPDWASSHLGKGTISSPGLVLLGACLQLTSTCLDSSTSQQADQLAD